MTMRHTTPFAARLLQRLIPSQDHGALIGDLQEERQRGRSRVWYIAQILAAIIVGSWKDIRTHRLLALRAIGIGIAALVLYFFAAGALLNFVQRRLYEGIRVHVGFLFSGWVIGRLHRAHGITFAVAFAAVLAMLLLALFVAAGVRVTYATPHPGDTYISPLWLLLCVVIGGWFATHRAEAA